MPESINALVKREMARRLADLEARAKTALMFFPADQLHWVYRQGYPEPLLRVTVSA